MISDADSFEQIAAMTLKAKASGTVSNPITLEAVDIDAMRAMVKKVEFTPPSE